MDVGKWDGGQWVGLNWETGMAEAVEWQLSFAPETRGDCSVLLGDGRSCSGARGRVLQTGCCQ